MAFVVGLGGLGLLLLLGLLLQLRIRLLRRLMLPVSLIGGFIGLAAGPYGVDRVPTDVVGLWSTVPGVLINYVFAALFVGTSLPSVRHLVLLGGPIFRFGVVTSLGQYLVGIALTGLVLAPLFGSSILFACIIEVGFAGGHGTAAAMTGVFDDLGFEAGGALGQMSATVGIVVGVITGMALIGQGVRRGHATQLSPEAGASRVASQSDRSGLIPRSERVSIARGTVRTSVMEPFTFHVAILSVAVLIGWVLQLAVRSLHPALSGFPLFPLAMIGGMLVQLVADRSGAAAYFDRGSVHRIMGLSLDLLVVAAIASLRLDLFLQNAVPFALLMGVGIVWTWATFAFLARRMMKTYWFEQGIVMYGTQTAVTAVGLMLLRVVDPENRTPAAQAFAARAMVASPLLGGGLVTATMPLLLLQFGLLPVFLVTLLVTLGAYFWPKRAKGLA
jgi:ESS family glutamate:Na+ symporter